MYRSWTVFRLAAVPSTPEDDEDRPTTQVAKARRIADRPLESMMDPVNCAGEGSEISVVPL